MAKILLTGFEPYLDYPDNSSWVVAEKVTTCGVDGVDLAIEQMPVSFSRVREALLEAVKRHSPNIIIMLGQSGVSDKIRLERVALNMMDSKQPDNDGYMPNEESIDKETPTALFTNISIKKLCAVVEEQNISVKISNSCGLYVCNLLYYEALKLCKECHMKAIFVHLPLYEGQPSVKHNKNTMPLDDMVKAIQTIIVKINEEDREF